MWAEDSSQPASMGGGDVFHPQGEGRATCDGKSLFKLETAFWCHPQALIGLKILDRLAYTLCIMVPNEDFAELIRSGTPVELDEEDLAVLRPAPVLCWGRGRE